MRHEDSESLTTIIGQLAEAGAPLGDGLRAAADELSPGTLHDTILELADAVDSGQSLDDALSQSDSATPTWLQGFVAAGLRSGSLGQVLSCVVERHRRTTQYWWEIRAALIYPFCIVAIAIVGTVILGSQLAVDVGIVMAEFQMEVPANTRLFSSAMNVAPAVLAVATPGLLACVFLLRYLVGRPRWHSWLATVPVFGMIRRWSSASQLAQLTSLLMRANVPLDESLRLVSGSMTDAAAAKACSELASKTSSGQPLSQAVANCNYFPKSLGAFVDWGVDTDSLPIALDAATDAFDGMMRIRSSSIRLIIPPIAFVFVGLLALYIHAAVVLPFAQLFNNF